jgi:5'-nucleotidase/UDP-sugar diphosphatase
MKLTLALLIVVLSISAEARLIQILHTNDLHSYFPGYQNHTGGYARVMTKIKELRESASERGIEVLQLDAGDWGDGTSFYLSDDGADSIRALALIGTEVATIGNHDHILGGKILGEQIRRANVSTKFVAANLETTPDMELDEVVPPFVDLEKAGIKIRVIGLTTSDDTFEYSMRPGGIESPVLIGEKEAKAAKEAGKELVIALTHIGQLQDRVLARSSTSIDVIVGGHSHSKLSQIDWENNKNGKPIPIVQAWAHGLGVGSLLLDIDDTGKITVVEYKLHEVASPVAPHPEMEIFIAASAEKRDRLFSTSWNEIIGHTHTPIHGYKDGMSGRGQSCWGRHLARAVRKATGASVGINFAGFLGVGKAAGPVTFGDIVDNMPHIRKYGDQGWEIATIYMSGWKLKPLMAWATRRGYGIDFSGLGYKVSSRGDPVDTIDDKATYRIAFPAEVAVAIKGSLPGYRYYLRGLKFTGEYYWPVMTEYVKTNSPINCR